MTTDARELLAVSSKAIRRSKSLYFRLDDAINLVKECEEKDLAVTRVEGLSLEHDGILPHLDLILDCLAREVDWTGFSWEQFRDKCNASAMEFLERTNGRRDLVFYFNVMRENEMSLPR